MTRHGHTSAATEAGRDREGRAPLNGSGGLAALLVPSLQTSGLRNCHRSVGTCHDRCRTFRTGDWDLCFLQLAESSLVSTQQQTESLLLPEPRPQTPGGACTDTPPPPGLPPAWPRPQAPQVADTGPKEGRRPGGVRRQRGRLRKDRASACLSPVRSGADASVAGCPRPTLSPVWKSLCPIRVPGGSQGQTPGPNLQPTVPGCCPSCSHLSPRVHTSL